MLELALLPIHLIDNATVIQSVGGVSVKGSARSATMLTFSAGWIAYAWIAFTLLWGRREGRVLGLLAGYLSIIIGIGLTFVEPGLLLCMAFALPLLQIPFVIAMHDLAPAWHSHFS